MKAQSGGRDIALLFLEHRCYMAVGGQPHASATLPTPGKEAGAHFTGGRGVEIPQGRSEEPNN
jgi:hypothetical protein